MGCLFSVFRLIWKIIKAVCKLIWKLLRLVLFRFGFIFIAVYIVAGLIVNAIWKIGFSFKGEMSVWYCVGLGLAAVCTAILIIRNSVKEK